jgi:hypothetical protein
MIQYARKRELIAIVKEGQKTFFAVGMALMEIRDSKLYVEEGTFEQFCEKHFGFGRAYAYRLIEGVKATETLPKRLSTKVDTLPAATAVAAVPAEHRAEVVTAAAATGSVTAKTVEKAAADIQEADVIVTDANGRTVPAGIVALWKEADRITEELLPLARKLKHEIKVGVEDKEKNLVWMDATNGDTSPIQATINLLTLTVAPHAVCYVCNGVRPQKCKLCRGRGFIGKHLWTTAPVEVKDMIKKASCK